MGIIYNPVTFLVCIMKQTMNRLTSKLLAIMMNEFNELAFNLLTTPVIFANAMSIGGVTGLGVIHITLAILTTAVAK